MGENSRELAFNVSSHYTSHRLLMIDTTLKSEKALKTAIIHYWLVGMRGGEKVIEQLCDLFPDADIFTHSYDPSAVSSKISAHRIRTTFISKLPGARQNFRRYLPLMPRALEAIDLSSYDLIISSESGPAKGVITAPDALHVCYVHSPMRYLWDQKDVYSADVNIIERLALSLLSPTLRTWDMVSAQRPDILIANSNFVRQRIKKSWGRDSSVIHPPVDVELFESYQQSDSNSLDSKEAPYLYVGELVGYKQPQAAVEACKRLDRNLVVVGTGPLLEKLKAEAGPRTQFKGRVATEELLQLYEDCKALLYPGVEDFGITPLEVAAAGRPTIALGRGGACETIVHERTGHLYQDPSVDGLINAIKSFESSDWFSPSTAIQQARAFRNAVFKAKFLAELLKVAPPRLVSNLETLADNTLTNPEKPARQANV